MRIRLVLLCVIVLAVALGSAVAQPVHVLVVTLSVAGTIQQGPDAGNYYIAFSTLPGMLRGPEPDGTGWTHYVLFQRGRFFFAPVRAIGPPPFRVTLPPQPYTRAWVMPDQKTLRVELPLNLLAAPRGGAVRQIKINAVTTDPTNRPYDALGRGPDDPLGWVTFDLTRDLFRRWEQPQGRAPADYDIVELTVTVQVP